MTDTDRQLWFLGAIWLSLVVLIVVVVFGAVLIEVAIRDLSEAL